MSRVELIARLQRFFNSAARRRPPNLRQTLSAPDRTLSLDEARRLVADYIDRLLSLARLQHQPTQPMPASATLKQRFEKFVDDAVTLDVVTLTGTIKLGNTHVTAGTPAVAGNGGVGATPAIPSKFNFDTLFDDVVAKLTVANQTDVQLLAFTRAQWDQDRVTFVSKDATAAEQALIDAHQKAVESAQKSRLDAVKFVGELVGGIKLG